MKTPMNLSDLERLVTEYTSQDHRSQGLILSLVSLIMNGKLTS